MELAQFIAMISEFQLDDELENQIIRRFAILSGIDVPVSQDVNHVDNTITFVKELLPPDPDDTVVLSASKSDLKRENPVTMCPMSLIMTLAFSVWGNG